MKIVPDQKPGIHIPKMIKQFFFYIHITHPLLFMRALYLLYVWVNVPFVGSEASCSPCCCITHTVVLTQPCNQYTNTTVSLNTSSGALGACKKSTNKATAQKSQEISRSQLSGTAPTSVQNQTTQIKLMLSYACANYYILPADTDAAPISTQNCT